jgi:hypothetical protein
MPSDIEAYPAARDAARRWRSERPDHVRLIAAGDGVAYPPSGSDLHRPELWRAPHWRWLAAHDARPDGFVAERRKHCTSPSLCFKLCGEEEPFCGPCDLQAVEALANKS